MENSKINRNIQNIYEQYPIEGEFKLDQKTNNGKSIPVEEINYGLYKKAANCVCFLTTNQRILAWISTLAQRLCYEKGQEDDKLEVIWRDVCEDGSSKVQTEFIVSKKQPASEGEFCYKVIVYLTTGKIMIQGKDYMSWCENEFPHCVKMVNDLVTNINTTETSIEDSDTTQLKQVVKDKKQRQSKYKPNAHTKSKSQSAQENGPIKNVIINERKHNAQENLATKESNNIEEADDNIDQNPIEYHQMLQVQFANRIDVLENGIYKLTDIISNLVSRVDKQNENMSTIERTTKCTIREELNKWEKKDNQDQEKVLRDELKCKNEEIKGLRRNLEEQTKNCNLQVEKLRKENVQLQKNKEELIDTRRDLKNEIYKLKTDADSSQQKIKDMKNELQQQQKTFDDRMKAKEDRIEQMVEIISELKGEKWEKKGEQNVKRLQENTTPAVTSTMKLAVDKPKAPETEIFIDLVEKENKNEILVLGDSVCKDINIHRLVAGSNKTGKGVRTSTIDKARERVEETQPVHTIIVHTGVNDLEKVTKGFNIKTICDNYIKLAKGSRKKASNVIMSLPLPGPSSGNEIENIVDEFNSRVKEDLKDVDGITVCSHEQINKRYLYRDEVHPSEQGTKILAANLRTKLKIKKPVANKNSRTEAHGVLVSEKQDRTTIEDYSRATTEKYGVVTTGKSDKDGRTNTNRNLGQTNNLNSDRNYSHSNYFNSNRHYDQTNNSTSNRHYGQTNNSNSNRHYGQEDNQNLNRNYGQANNLANDLVRVLTNFLQQK